MDNLLIRFSKCCNPVPGDEIIGFITKGRGISVHRKGLYQRSVTAGDEKARFIEVEWDKQRIICPTTPTSTYWRKTGKACSPICPGYARICDVHIAGVNAKSAKDGIINITMTLSISNTSQIEKVLRSLRSVPGVADVYRAII